MSNNGSATRFCNDSIGPTAFERVAIVGGGAWGTALALTACRAGRHVSLWARDWALDWARERSVVDAIAQTRHNPFLPSALLPSEIVAIDDLQAAPQDKQLVALVVPLQHLRSIARRAELNLPDHVPVRRRVKAVVPA